MIKHISTTREEKWSMKKVSSEQDIEVNNRAEVLKLTSDEYQTVEGFGGCFNELGWLALEKISETKKEEILDQLFDQNTGCKFNYCRLPIGASDYAAEWYSCAPEEFDYEMENFTIKRDKKYLIPYIKSALKRNDEINLFASPWSPPVWMKEPKAYNYGTLIQDKKILDAYARYFLKFIEAYKEENINIEQVHVQNEPMADQKFPSCVWTGEELRDFIKNHLGPLFAENDFPAEIWLGTINSPFSNYGGLFNSEAEHKQGNYHSYAETVLWDSKARNYITGIGYQWGGKNAIAVTHQSWPEKKSIQTENECGNGKNSWDYAHYVFDLLLHYFNNGVSAYTYWNMVLEKGGESTWGWRQNSMISIDPENEEVIYNPEFYLMKHLAAFVQKGAVRIGLKGAWTGNALAFKNQDNSIIVAAHNPLTEERNLILEVENMKYKFEIEAESFNTIEVKAE